MNSPYHKGLPGYHRHAPETSRLAAESIASVAGSIRAKVLGVVHAAGSAGIMADDVADRLDLTVYQVRARLAELHTGKEIAYSGRQATGRSGRKTAIWVLARYAPAPEPEGPVGEQGDLFGNTEPRSTSTGRL